MSNLTKWEKEHQVFSLSSEFLSTKLLTMSDDDFKVFVDGVRKARKAQISNKEAVDFAKELSKDVIIPLIINSAKK